MIIVKSAARVLMFMLILLPAFFFGSGCKPFKKSDLQQSMDSLKAAVYTLHNTQLLDVEVIRLRADSIRRRLEAVPMYVKDTTIAEIATALARLRAIGRIYQEVLVIYPPAEYDASVAEQELPNWLKLEDPQKLRDKQVFTDSLVNITRRVNKDIYSVEKEYLRQSNLLGSAVDRFIYPDKPSKNAKSI